MKFVKLLSKGFVRALLAVTVTSLPALEIVGTGVRVALVVFELILLGVTIRVRLMASQWESVEILTSAIPTSPLMTPEMRASNASPSSP